MSVSVPYTACLHGREMPTAEPENACTRLSVSMLDSDANAPAPLPPETGGRVPLHVIGIIVVSIALLVVNASLLIINTAATMDSNAHYARSTEIKRALITFQSVITALESAQRGSLLTGQTAYLEPYPVAMRSWRIQID